MSFNIGAHNSRYVAVSNITMRFDFSEKVLFADLRTSRKTGRFKTDGTGEIVTDEKGNAIPERVYTYWEGRFVGNALEPAKALRSGQTINILNGWIDKEVWKGGDNKRHEKVYAVITDFELADFTSDEDDNEDNGLDVESIGKEIDGVSAAFRSLNGDENTPVNAGRR